MTLRRLAVLVRGLPPEAQVWAEAERARLRALKPTPEQIKARQAYYDQQAKGG